MSVGGVSNLGASNNHNQGGQGANANGESSGKEFALEKQATGEAASTAIASRNKTARSKSSHIVDRKKKNRKGAPRTILVDGDLYEVFLLAIA